jgi:hypothetical protein
MVTTPERVREILKGLETVTATFLSRLLTTWTGH